MFNKCLKIFLNLELAKTVVNKNPIKSDPIIIKFQHIPERAATQFSAAIE